MDQFAGIVSSRVIEEIQNTHEKAIKKYTPEFIRLYPDWIKLHLDVSEIEIYLEFKQQQLSDSRKKLLEIYMRQVPPNIKSQLEEGSLPDIIFFENLSQMKHHIEKSLDIMIDYLVDHKLHINEALVGQFKPQLD